MVYLLGKVPLLSWVQERARIFNQTPALHALRWKISIVRTRIHLEGMNPLVVSLHPSLAEWSSHFPSSRFIGFHHYNCGGFSLIRRRYLKILARRSCLLIAIGGKAKE